MGGVTITEFLEARIAEDEAWVLRGECQCDDGRLPNCPDRVLAECEAKRRIVELHTAYATPQVMIYGTITACETCGSVDDSPVEWPCDTLKALAAVYADHPDYREEWRP